MSNNDDILFNDATNQNSQAGNDQPRYTEPRADSTNTQQQQSNQTQAWTLADLGNVQSRPSLGGLTDGALTLMIDTFDAAKGRANGRVPDEISSNRFKAIQLVGARFGSQMSSLLIALPTTIAGKSYAIVYVALIEPSGPMSTRSLSDGQGTYEALYLPEDRLTEKYVKAIRDEVLAHIPGAQVVIAGRQVITQSIVAQLNEKEGVSIIERIFDNSFDAICGYRQNMSDAITGKRTGGNRINPDAVGRRDRLEASFDFSGAQPQDTSGLPIGSDVAMTIWYSSADTDEEGNYNRVQLAEVRMGLNLFLDQSSKQGTLGFGRSRGRSKDDPAPFQAVLSINNVTAPQGVPFSLEMAQLAIASTAILSNDYRWAEILRPRVSLPSGLKPAFNIKDLVHYADVDDERKQQILQVVTPNINDQDLSNYLDLVVQPQIAFAISTPSSCEKSWVLSIFEKIATAKNDAERRALITTLYDSADILTGSRFRKVFRELGCDDSTPPVVLTGNPTLVGTWVDADGKERALSELNVPAYLSRVGAKGLDAVEDFQFTIQDDRRPIPFNLAERFTSLNKCFGSVHVVTTAEQVGFLPAYLQALNIALSQANMTCVPTSLEGTQTRRRPASGGYAGLATNDIGSTRRSSTGLSGLSGRGSDPFGGRYF